MEVQNQYPLIQEIGLENCLNKSSYIELIQTKAIMVIEHNEPCRTCEYKNSCMGGCRASALETTPDDFLAIDKASCEYYRGGWADKVKETVEQAALRFSNLHETSK